MFRRNGGYLNVFKTWCCQVYVAAALQRSVCCFYRFLSQAAFLPLPVLKTPLGGSAAEDTLPDSTLKRYFLNTSTVSSETWQKARL
jgi:hypothetical protein